MRHLSSFPWTISSFRDPREVIGGCFLLQNGLQPLWYIFYKSWYILYKIWYILHQIWHILHKIWYILKTNLSHPILELLGPLFITHGPFILLGIFGKWFKVISYSKINFRTLGTSLRKFDTSNPWANGTPISLLMVHFFLWRPSGSDWSSFLTSEWTLTPLVHHLQNLVHHSQNLVHS